MKAGPVVVGQLLQNRNRYCVPIYQRRYVWDRARQWEPFWNDIRTKAIERLSGRERRFSHFMGAVVLESRGGYSARQVPSFQVVDGQQRLTTFQLFLAAARDYAKSIGYTSTEQKIEMYLLNSDPRLMEQPDVEIFKVWPTFADRDLFVDILTLGGREALRDKYGEYFYKSRDSIYIYKTTPKLLAAYGYFYDQIRLAAETDDLDDEFHTGELPLVGDFAVNNDSDALPPEIRLDAVWQALVEEFKLVEISLDEGDDAQVIFETLNERGEPLLATDLVRNNIFQRADAGREDAEKLFREYWASFEEPFWSQQERQGRYRKPRIEFFLANYIAGKIAGEVNLSTLFSEYKAFQKSSMFSSVSSELQELSRFGGIYRNIVGRDTDNPLSTFGRRLLPWDVTTVYPLVMRIWASVELSQAEKEDALDFLLSFIVRRAVCGLTTKNYNKLFLAAVAHLDARTWSREHLIAYLLNQTSDIARMPRDDEFNRSWIDRPIYQTLSAPRTRALLEELERAKRNRFHETSELSSDLTVEHVMPRQWSSHWPLEGGYHPTFDEISRARMYQQEDHGLLGRIARRNRLIETIGNLTLLTQPLNSTISNGPHDEKVRSLRDHSLLVLNREIAHRDHWDEEAILGRSQDLFETAIQIWPFPSTD